MAHIIKLTYFKRSGKYYTEGEYHTVHTQMYDVFDEVRALRNAGRLPGLEGGGKEFIIHVDPGEHPHGYPGLIVHGPI